MRWYESKTTCADCGVDIPLKSFRTPTIWCAACAPRHAADLWRERLGCLLCIPTAIVVGYGCGWISFQLGRFLTQIIPFPNLAPLISFVAGIDAVAITGIYFTKKFAFARIELKVELTRVGVLCAFGLIGMRCARGMGIETALIAGVLNTLLIIPIVFWLIPRRTATHSSEQFSARNMGNK